MHRTRSASPVRQLFVWGVGLSLLGIAGRTEAAFAPRHAQAQLIAEDQTIQPGHPLRVALRLTLEDGWHTYWKNPGDAGLAPTVTWTLPTGFRAGPLQWPAPKRLAEPPLVSYGYEGEVWLLSELEVPTSVSPDAAVALSAHAEWVVCSALCVNEATDVRLELPVSAATPTADSRWAEAFAKARAQLPVTSSAWTFRASSQGRTMFLTAIPPASTPTSLSSLIFFPEERGVIEPAATQALTRTQDGYVLKLVRSLFSTAASMRLRGVLVSSAGWREDGSGPALEIDVPVE